MKHKKFNPVTAILAWTLGALSKKYFWPVLVIFCFIAGCSNMQHIPKPTMTEQIVSSAAKVQEKPLFASIMETKGLPVIFIGAIAGGVFVLVFLGRADTGLRLGLALISLGVSGLVVTATYQRHAETISN